MKTSIASRTRVAARIGVTLAALATLLATLGCAAGDPPGTQQGAAVSAPMPALETAVDMTPQCDARAAAHEISLQDPQGALLELAYVPECGWQYTTSRHPVAALKEVAVNAMHPISASHAAVDSPENPLAVYIDGPTGYAFAWTREGGWKFIGHVDEHASRRGPN